MTGVIYARYSSDNQREESTLGQIPVPHIKVLFLPKKTPATSLIDFRYKP